MVVTGTLQYIPAPRTTLRTTLQGGLWVLPAVRLLVHLAMLTRYGMQRDEYYFVACGLHPDWGYVDHPPLVPWIAGAIYKLFGDNLFALRLPAVFAGTVLVILTMHTCEWFGGDRFARLLAGLAVIVAPAYLRMAGMLNLPVFEQLFWLGASLLVLQIGKHARPLSGYLLVGVVAGLGLLNKHSMLLWGAGIVVAMLLTPLRRDLRTRWPYIGAAVALIFFLPNLLWQAQNDWATLEFLQGMSDDTLRRIPRALFLLGQVLYMHPLTVPIWGAGLWWLWKSGGRYARPFTIQYVVVVVVLLFTSAKPYYLAPVYPLLFAAGGVQLSHWNCRWARSTRWAMVAGLIVGGGALGVLTVPLLPLDTVDATIAKLFGGAIPPKDLTQDAHDQYGWEDQARALAGATASITEQLRDRSVPLVIVAGNYGEASALQYYQRRFALPPIYSGNMSQYLWPPPDGSFRVVTYGLGPKSLDRLCKARHALGVIEHPLALETGIRVLLCDEPVELGEGWPSLKLYRHSSE